MSGARSSQHLNATLALVTAVEFQLIACMINGSIIETNTMSDLTMLLILGTDCSRGRFPVKRCPGPLSAFVHNSCFIFRTGCYFNLVRDPIGHRACGATSYHDGRKL